MFMIKANCYKHQQVESLLAAHLTAAAAGSTSDLSLLSQQSNLEPEQVSRPKATHRDATGIALATPSATTKTMAMKVECATPAVTMPHIGYGGSHLQ
jgi:hypothetical protein